ncbi:VOC family protein [Rhizobium sp. FKY42]|uniref:bleomycin resistance protein n=1 Tax=Rhizobium sp. FKY42 TaxID=2562310 RepID=UPI0010C07DA9|nr:VOC family protein [Rhizobium sp. FKY42]
MTENALVPELAVFDWSVSRDFYTDIIGFDVLYERPEEGFSFLAFGSAQLMIDQIGIGRTFESGAPLLLPLGRGLNLQIRVDALETLLKRLAKSDYPLYLPPEEKCYRRDTVEIGHRQFIVADPDGYLLRLYEDIGTRLSQS